MKKHNLTWQYVLAGVALVIMLQATNTHCQNLIMELPYVDEYSIIRNIDTDNKLIYNHGKDNRFYKIDYNIGTGTTMSFPGRDEMKILDFEIHEDYVFFCGIEDTLSPKAVFGYFNLGDFPNCTIYFDVRDEWASFNKLDVFKVEEEYHVVMTATYHSGYGTMIDVRGDGSGVWTYCDADFRDEQWFFHDVAVTKDYIVYTSTGGEKESITKSHPGLWYIKKPTIPGVPIFSNVLGDMNLEELTVSVLGEILIEHIRSNEIAIVHRSGMYDFKVSYFQGFSYQQTISVGCYNDCVIKDIKNGLVAMQVEVLVNNTSANTPERSAIYSIPYAAPGPFSTVNHKYATSNNEVINSIDIMLPTEYVGSGHDFWGQDLHAYSINMPPSGICFDNLGNRELVEYFEWDCHEKDFPHRSYTYEIGTIEPESDDLETEIICNESKTK